MLDNSVMWRECETKSKKNKEEKRGERVWLVRWENQINEKKMAKLLEGIQNSPRIVPDRSEW